MKRQLSMSENKREQQKYKISDELLFPKHIEAAIQSCSVKKMYLEILQSSQENTCTGVSFLIKLLSLRPATF